jgi:hypothetical protein
MAGLMGNPAAQAGQEAANAGMRAAPGADLNLPQGMMPGGGGAGQPPGAGQPGENFSPEDVQRLLTSGMAGAEKQANIGGAGYKAAGVQTQLVRGGMQSPADASMAEAATMNKAKAGTKANSKWGLGSIFKNHPGKAGAGIGILVGLLLGSLLKETVGDTKNQQTQANLAMNTMPPAGVMAQNVMLPQQMQQTNMLNQLLMSRMSPMAGQQRPGSQYEMPM